VIGTLLVEYYEPIQKRIEHDSIRSYLTSCFESLFFLARLFKRFRHLLMCIQSLGNERQFVEVFVAAARSIFANAYALGSDTASRVP
jgi:hypothetical protein